MGHDHKKRPCSARVKTEAGATHKGMTGGGDRSSAAWNSGDRSSWWESQGPLSICSILCVETVNDRWGDGLCIKCLPHKNEDQHSDLQKQGKSQKPSRCGSLPIIPGFSS